MYSVMSMEASAIYLEEVRFCPDKMSLVWIDICGFSNLLNFESQGRLIVIVAHNLQVVAFLQVFLDLKR